MDTPVGETRRAGVEALHNSRIIIKRLHAANEAMEDCMRGERPKETSDQAADKKVKCGTYYYFSKFMERLPTIGGAEMKESSSELEELLRFGACQIVQLIIPVCVCIVVVVVFQLTIEVYSTQPKNKVIYLPFGETSSSSGANFLYGLVNAIVVVAFIVVVTVIFVLLMKFKCDKALFVWTLIVSGVLMFMASSSYLLKIVIVRNLVIDWFTFVLITWNIESLGLIVIHWKSPLRLQQAYLILSSAILAIVIIAYFPEWTTWILLAGISVYDMFSVLCPKGPLNILVKIVKERDIKLPGLIYSSTMIWIVGMADVNRKSTASDTVPFSTASDMVPKGSARKTSFTSRQNEDGEPSGGKSDEYPKENEGPCTSEQWEQDKIEEEEGQTKILNEEGSVEQEEEKRGFKLGLGDFIFYSVLVGKAASISDGNWIIIVSCCVAILMGLCLTSLILGVVHKALPALLISIFFGLVFYFTSQYILAPYVEMLNVNQVFI